MSGGDERFLLERMTWEEADAAITGGLDAVLVPIGTQEQHGPHLPLDTDCVIARGLHLDIAADPPRTPASAETFAHAAVCNGYHEFREA